MASISNDAGGRKRIQFVDIHGDRKTIRFGKISVKQAQAYKVKIESLVTALATGTSDDETTQWAMGLPPLLRRRMERVGLLRPSKGKLRKLGDFVAAYFDWATVKKSTATTYKQTSNDLIGHFGKSADITHIGPLEAEGWRKSMVKAKLMVPTISKRVKTARQMFKRAQRWGIIAENPFADVVTGGETNPDRWHFIPRDVATKVIDACPDAEWRLVFALSRYGGLRCPSEHVALRWSDVDFKNARITVRASKTEHHANKGIRVIPLFDELLPYLEDAREMAEPGATFVIAKHRGRNQNLRTQLLRILKVAGVDPWPRLFQNLRSTRETELVESYPVHVACAWIGNSERIAAKHYLQVHDEHFRKAAHKAAQQPAAQGGTMKQDDTENPTGATKSPVPATGTGDVVTPTGLEQVTGFGRKYGKVRESGAKSGALVNRDTLPDALRMRIAARRVRNATRTMRNGGGK